jgi:hypothetical protein
MLSGKAKVRNVERCKSCGLVSSSVDLVTFKGECWYCWIDTSQDATAVFVRQRHLYDDGQKGAEIRRRRMKRAQVAEREAYMSSLPAPSEKRPVGDN